MENFPLGKWGFITVFSKRIFGNNFEKKVSRKDFEKCQELIFRYFLKNDNDVLRVLCWNILSKNDWKALCDILWFETASSKYVTSGRDMWNVGCIPWCDMMSVCEPSKTREGLGRSVMNVILRITWLGYSSGRWPDEDSWAIAWGLLGSE